MAPPPNTTEAADNKKKKFRIDLEFQASYSEADVQKLLAGFYPIDMDERWKVSRDADGWVYFQRSWTGHYIFAIKLDLQPASLRSASGGGDAAGTTARTSVTESWYNGNRHEYNNSFEGKEYQQNFLKRLIKMLFGIDHHVGGVPDKKK